jgi:alkylhydroperoxidase family enzyme
MVFSRDLPLVSTNSILLRPKGGTAVPPVNPISNENSSDELREAYNSLAKKFGRIPNFLAVMAHRPSILKNFMPHHSGVMAEGTVEPRYKELAYLKVSMLNGCEY